MKKLSAYDIYKTIHTELSSNDNIQTVLFDYDKALYHHGGKEGYYTIDIMIRAEGATIGAYNVYYHSEEEGIFDVYSGLICQGENPKNTVQRILHCIARNEYEWTLLNRETEYC